MSLPKFILVLGGAASGKSSFAESLCFQSPKSRVYIATAQGFDNEMRAKISDHRSQRGPEWLTIEAPLNVASALSTCSAKQIVLLDCATLWLSNVLLADEDAAIASATLLAALATCPAQVIVVSNEVGHGIVPDNKLTRQFRNAQGRLNQLLAARADLVVQVTAGLPQTLKGEAGMLI
ncbi:bifunctional adenosylcobalamin biosynthesis protein CobP [Octadecabacter antarcticus 307]|uniref:Bifunctional adenosylcobalamin biosynthesis protein n=1 Tax=Octadecabacter antarcticus 307 TaxID=391626 RepID=M9RHL4_9RHOB|nr:bifunctional adenosylcobinamide kinase/adenosylcobinamide-phosphate guanylyltransferase [Octadecabacter antarcticus]AGI69330.1 bifunctional adenosylcobalamin biosynthesis protein CobP [Octadecabacter antarcticus 307]